MTAICSLPKYDQIPMMFLNLVLQSAFIPDTKLVSCAFISHAGLNKTGYLSTTINKDFVYYVADITPSNLVSFVRDVDDGKKKFIVIPDYVSIVSHNKRTVNLAESWFRSLMQEGLPESKAYNMEFTCKDKNNPPKAGLITAITTEHANQNTGRWKASGFYSRLLPFSYTHDTITVNDILLNKWKKIHTYDIIDLPIIQNAHDVQVPELANKDIQLIAKDVIEPNEFPYRSYDLITALCKSHAVLRDSKQIEDVDIDMIRSIAKYLNRNENSL